MGGVDSTGKSCALNQEGSIASFLAELGVVYSIEMVSYSSEQGFDLNEAGTNGFLRISQSRSCLKFRIIFCASSKHSQSCLQHFVCLAVVPFPGFDREAR
jgi:hypothetical protein